MRKVMWRAIFIRQKNNAQENDSFSLRAVGRPSEGRQAQSSTEAVFYKHTVTRR
jgi:hypothetical protein